MKASVNAGIFFLLLMFATTIPGHAEMQNQKEVELSVSSADIGDGELRITYKIVNKGPNSVFVVDSDDWCPETEWKEYFFVKLDPVSQTLRLDSHVADLPMDALIIAPMSHPVRKVYPGQQYTNTLRVRFPIQEKFPYPKKVGMAIGSDKIKRVNLTLGLIDCDSLPTHQINGSKANFVSATYQVSCAQKSGPLVPITHFQFFLNAGAEVK